MGLLALAGLVYYHKEVRSPPPQPIRASTCGEALEYHLNRRGTVQSLWNWHVVKVSLNDRKTILQACKDIP